MCFVSEIEPKLALWYCVISLGAIYTVCKGLVINYGEGGS